MSKLLNFLTLGAALLVTETMATAQDRPAAVPSVTPGTIRFKGLPDRP